MDTFDLKRFLVENKLTRNSILLKENINIDKQGNLIYSLEDADIDYSDSSEILLTWEIDEINPNLIRKFEWDDTEDTIHTYIDVDKLKDFIKNPVELIKKFEAPNGYVVVDKQDARDLMESYYENFEDEIDPELNENHLTRNSILEELKIDKLDGNSDVDDLPTVTLTIMDDSFENSQAPTLKLDLSAMWHSGDNGKIQILKDNPELQQEVMQKMQKEVQATFRKVIHSILGEPYGLDEFKRK